MKRTALTKNEFKAYFSENFANVNQYFTY